MIRLLIADNNVDLCNILNRFFEQQEDFEVVGIAHDGKQALRLIHEKEPDAVTLDLSMPILDGIAVMERMPDLGLSHRPHVIVLSAFAREDLMTKMLQLGVDYYIPKPFDFGVLAVRIRQFAGTEESAAEERGSDPIVTAVAEGSSTSKFSNRNLADTVTQVMHQMGVPAHYRGYSYLRDAVLLVLQEETILGGNLHKLLYPRIASRYETTVSAVEAAIRNAIITAWQKGNPQYIASIIGKSAAVSSSGIPSNAIMLAKISDRLRVSLHMNQAIGNPIR